MCKRRYQSLYYTITTIFGHLRDNRILLQRFGDKPFIKEGKDTEIIIDYGIEGVEPFRINLMIHNEPRFYRYLLKSYCSGITNVIYERSLNYSEDLILENLRKFSIIILTLGKSYENLRPDMGLKPIMELEAIENLEKSETPLGSELKSLFTSVKEDLQLGRKSPNYIRDFLQLLNPSPRKYDMELDYHISLKKTGTSLIMRKNTKRHKSKKIRVSLDGLSSSVIEVDNCKSDLDDLIGYTSHYRSHPVENSTQLGCMCTGVYQTKFDPRIIFCVENPRQDRLTWYENVINLERLMTDCTEKQASGKMFAIKWTDSINQIESEENSYNIYCLDITKATDTLNREFQEMCISLILNEQLAHYWIKLVSPTIHYRGAYKDVKDRIVDMKRGQPQGFKSSFKCFALIHHIIFRCLMKKMGLEFMHPEDFYRVLGDDSIFVCHDPNGSIRQEYANLCNQMGWEIKSDHNLNYDYYKNTQAIAEFAKARYLNGKFFSNIPSKLFFRLHQLHSEIPLAVVLYLAEQESPHPNLASDYTLTHIQNLPNAVPGNQKIIRNKLFQILCHYRLGSFKKNQREYSL
uniref:Putative replicase n=1 Tax=Cansystermes virus TaxID=2796581 RepID=A0A7T7GUX4_9VIRU|nr:putative replicase [Cansystermes virus]